MTVERSFRLGRAQGVGGTGHRLLCGAMAEIRAEITANVWQVVVDEGQLIAEGDEICILESMKMEIPVVTETPGVVRELHVAPEQVVHEGDLIAVIDES
jgi:acetyl-CoA carboxylase biotin carboxyl carrier protein